MSLIGRPSDLSRGQLATLACLYEVTAPKPGNVHRGADFDDMTFFDFVDSAVAIAPAFDAALQQPVGQTVLQSVVATRKVVNKNTNLGIVLLLAPLAKVADAIPSQEGVAAVLRDLNSDDARDVYEAIRLAAPGGLGKSDQQDVNETSPDAQDGLVAAMRLAEDRDHVAYQYANDYGTVFDHIVPDLVTGLQRGAWPDAIVHAHVCQMARTPDTLIRRKCGDEVAQQSADRAAAVVSSGDPDSETYHAGLRDLDFWLRSDGHRRNPGTTADLIAAGLFVVLRDGV